jgi:hypothetical protein
MTEWTDDEGNALIAYWQAKSLTEEHAAYLRLKAMGWPASYGEISDPSPAVVEGDSGLNAGPIEINYSILHDLEKAASRRVLITSMFRRMPSADEACGFVPMSGTTGDQGSRMMSRDPVRYGAESFPERAKR